MNLKDFKLKSEADDTIHLEHPSGKIFTVEKSKLSPMAMKKVMKLCSGGNVQKLNSDGTVEPEPEAPDALNIVPPAADIATQAIQTPATQAFPTPSAEDVFQKRVQDEMTRRAVNSRSGEAPDQDQVEQSIMAQMSQEQANAKTDQQKQAGDLQAKNAMRQSVGLAPLPVPSELAPPQAAPQPIMPQDTQQMNPLAANQQAIGNIFDQESQNVKNYQKNMDAAFAGQQNAYNNFVNEQGLFAGTFQDKMNDLKAKDDNALKAFAEQKIDPDRYFKSRGTIGNILGAIGVALGGAGGGSSGRNAALDTLNGYIARDIDAQRNDQSKAMNLWKMNREQSQSDMQATLMTHNQLMSGMQAKIAQAAGSSQNAQVKLNANMMLSDIEQRKQASRYQQALLSGGINGPGAAGINPALLIPQSADPATKKAALEEVSKLQNISANSDKMQQLFEQAAKENTVMRTGAGMLREPGSVMALKQLMLPNFKSIDGTVRQAAMDESFHNILPQPGDSDTKTAYKRQALTNWINSESASPNFTNVTGGLNLNNFASTSMNPMLRQSPQIQRMAQAAKAYPGTPQAEAFYKKYPGAR